MKKVLALITLIFINNCANKISKELPSWYLNPPQNDSLNLYGVGYGFDKQNSEQNALDNLAQKIIVNISSSIEVLKQENSYNQKSNFSESSQQKIKSEVAKISFMNFNNEKTEIFNKQIYSLVSVNRHNLINQYEQKIIDFSDEINQIQAQQKNKTLIEKKADFIQIEKIIAKAENDLIILDSINLDKNKNAEIKAEFKALKLAHKAINNDLNLYIKYDHNSQKVAEIVKTAFAKENIKTNAKKIATKNEVIVDISSKQTKQFIYGTYIIKSQINIAFLNNKGQIIKNKILQESGSSSISYDEAGNNLARKFSKKINKKNDIFAELGFN